MTLNHELRGVLRSWAMAQGRLAMKRTVHLGMALVLALTFLIGGLSLTAPSAHAATTTTTSSPTGNGIGGACQNGGTQFLSYIFTGIVSSFFNSFTPVTVSQGACASLFANLTSNPSQPPQVDTSAPFVSICQSVAVDYGLPGQFVGFCVSSLSMNKAQIY
jgi:hypothetical protein